MENYPVENEDIMVCPFFLKSICREGENCEFSHTMTKILPENVACDFYQRGMCKYGKKCWFSHAKSATDINIVERSESYPSKNAAPAKIKKRFSFVLKDIHDRRKANMQDCFNKLEITKFFPEMTKLNNSSREDGAKLPMERCIHYDIGNCPLRGWCPCVHGKLCDLCQKYCLDPYDKNQRTKHIEECEKELERDMELSFAIQCSKDKVCGICLEVILDKEKIVQRRFGILEKCNHVFCLECIREWRRRGGNVMDSVHPDAAIDQHVMRKCPQCRIRSDFIIPSNFWFHSDEEKVVLIEKYKSNLKWKHCKYFNKGEGDCPFGNRCFYLHALPDGTVVELPAPTRQNRRRLNRGRDGQMLEELILWNYLDQNEDGLQFYIDDVSFDGSDIVIL